MLLRLPRIHCFEFHEKKWFAAACRHAITECVRLWSVRLGMERAISPMVVDLLRSAPTPRIIDLCSGSSGPIPALLSELDKAGVTVEVTLTDLFPDREAFAWAASATGGRVVGWPEPVDAARVPASLAGVRTFFNSFHHFSPEAARAILEDAYRQRQPILIAEITERSAFRAALTFLHSATLMFRYVSSMRPPARPSVWIFTYLIPVLPLALAWDAMISCLRSYSEEELRQLCSNFSRDWAWEFSRIPVPGLPVHICCFSGRLAVAESEVATKTGANPYRLAAGLAAPNL